MSHDSITERRSSREKKESQRTVEAKNDEWIMRHIRFDRPRDQTRPSRPKPEPCPIVHSVDTHLLEEPSKSGLQFQSPKSRAALNGKKPGDDSVHPTASGENRPETSEHTKDTKKRNNNKKIDTEVFVAAASPRPKRPSPSNTKPQNTEHHHQPRASPSSRSDSRSHSSSESPSPSVTYVMPEVIPVLSNDVLSDPSISATAVWTGDASASPPPYSAYLHPANHQRTFYSGVSINGVDFNIFDHVLIARRSGARPEAVARIVSLFDEFSEKKVILEWFYRKADLLCHLNSLKIAEDKGRSPTIMDCDDPDEDPSKPRKKRGRPPKKRRQNLEESLVTTKVAVDYEIFNSTRPFLTISCIAALGSPCTVDHTSNPHVPALHPPDDLPHGTKYFFYRRSFDHKTCSLTLCKVRSTLPVQLQQSGSPKLSASAASLISPGTSSASSRSRSGSLNSSQNGVFSTKMDDFIPPKFSEISDEWTRSKQGPSPKQRKLEEVDQHLSHCLPPLAHGSDHVIVPTSMTDPYDFTVPTGLNSSFSDPRDNEIGILRSRVHQMQMTIDELRSTIRSMQRYIYHSPEHSPAVINPNQTRELDGTVIPEQLHLDLPQVDHMDFTDHRSHSQFEEEGHDSPMDEMSHSSEISPGLSHVGVLGNDSYSSSRTVSPVNDEVIGVGLPSSDHLQPEFTSAFFVPESVIEAS